MKKPEFNQASPDYRLTMACLFGIVFPATVDRHSEPQNSPVYNSQPDTLQVDDPSVVEYQKSGKREKERITVLPLTAVTDITTEVVDGKEQRVLRPSGYVRKVGFLQTEKKCDQKLSNYGTIPTTG